MDVVAFMKFIAHDEAINPGITRVSWFANFVNTLKDETKTWLSLAPVKVETLKPAMFGLIDALLLSDCLNLLV